jgi:hypothetical protein
MELFLKTGRQGPSIGLARVLNLFAPLPPLPPLPDEIVSMPPLNSLTLLVVVPSTSRMPLEMVKWLAMPPDEMVSVPPLSTAKVAVPPFRTSSVPPRWRSSRCS